MGCIRAWPGAATFDPCDQVGAAGRGFDHLGGDTLPREHTLGKPGGRELIAGRVCAVELGGVQRDQSRKRVPARSF